MLTPGEVVKSVQVENAQRIHVVLAVEQAFERSYKLGLAIKTNTFFHKEISHRINTDLFRALQLFVDQQSELFDQPNLFVEIENIVFKCSHL